VAQITKKKKKQKQTNNSVVPSERSKSVKQSKWNQEYYGGKDLWKRWVEMSFKSGVKARGSDRWWERRWWLWWGDMHRMRWTRRRVNRMRLTEWRRELIPQVRWCISKSGWWFVMRKIRMIKLGWKQMRSEFYIDYVGSQVGWSWEICRWVKGIYIQQTVAAL